MPACTDAMVLAPVGVVLAVLTLMVSVAGSAVGRGVSTRYPSGN
jgi:hypothetical protein